MPRFQRNLDADLPNPDGLINLSFYDMIVAAGGGTGAYTRIASGEWSYRISTTTAAQVAVPLSGVLFRFGANDDTQNIFGSARAVQAGSQGQPVGWPNTLSTSTVSAGAAVSIPVLSSVNFAVGMPILVDTVASGVQEYTYITAIADGTHVTAALVNGHTTPFPISGNVFTTPGSVSGSPPYTGVTEFTSVASRPKGVLIKQITPRYIINTANLGTNTIGMTSITYTNNVVAPAATTLLTNAANGLATAFQANPYVTPIPIPVANQVWLTNRNTDVTIEWDVTNTGTGTVDLLGIEVICSFNFD